MSKVPKKEIISQDPGVVSGALVFAGTRVPAKNLVDYLKAGHDLDDFLDAFPGVSREQAEGYLELALEAVEKLHKGSPVTRCDRASRAEHPPSYVPRGFEEALRKELARLRLPRPRVAEPEDASGPSDLGYVASTTCLSRGTRIALHSAGVRLVQDLARMDPSAMLSLPGIDLEGLAQIDAVLEGGPAAPPTHVPYGLRLDQSEAYGRLSTRTRNCLLREGIFHVTHLASVPDAELLEIEAFGSVCLREVHAFLDAHRFDGEREVAPRGAEARFRAPPRAMEELLGLLSVDRAARSALDGWSWQAPAIASGAVTDLIEEARRQANAGLLHAHAIMCWPPLLRMSARLTPVALSLHDLLGRVQYAAASEPQGRWPSRPFEELKAALGTLSLEAELSGLLADLGPRSVVVLRARFSPNKRTLAALGEELGVTEGRVSQLQSVVRKELVRLYEARPLPRLRTAMMIAASGPLRSFGGVLERLCEVGLIPDESPRGERTMNDFFSVWRAVDPALLPFPALLKAIVGFERMDKHPSPQPRVEGVRKENRAKE